MFDTANDYDAYDEPEEKRVILLGLGNPEVNSWPQIDDEGEYDGETFPRVENEEPHSEGGFWDDAG